MRSYHIDNQGNVFIMTHNMTHKGGRSDIPLSRENIFLIIWTVIFGTALAVGGSALEPLPLPGLSVTAASPFVALMITLNKLVVFRRFSVTAMYAVAGTIAIFTTYLGPPTILKPLYVIAGLCFDAATLFRTENLRFWNIVLGHLAISVSGFFIFWLIILIMIPGSANAIGKLLLIAAPVHFGISVVIAWIVFRLIPPKNPPKNPPRIVATIRSQMQASTHILMHESVGR
jgi:hypothetical protein